jgi:hypothetical protein
MRNSSLVSFRDRRHITLTDDKTRYVWCQKPRSVQKPPLTQDFVGASNRGLIVEPAIAGTLRATDWCVCHNAGHSGTLGPPRYALAAGGSPHPCPRISVLLLDVVSVILHSVSVFLATTSIQEMNLLGQLALSPPHRQFELLHKFWLIFVIYIQ